jgi:hypothetical protein
MSLGIIGIDPSRVTTSAEFALGVRGAVEDQTTGSGVKEYMYVSFPAATAVPLGNVSAINSITGSAVQITNALAAAGQAVGKRLGVSPVAVASNAAVQFGWLQIYGAGLVVATNAIAINTALTTTVTAGQLGAGGVAASGVVLTAAGVTNTAVACTLNYPFLA